MLWAFSTIIVYAQNDKESKKEDFCAVLGQVCTHKTVDSTKAFIFHAYNFDSISVDTAVYSSYADSMYIIGLYKEHLLSTEDSFALKLSQIPKGYRYRYSNGYRYFYRRYHKGLQVLNDRSILVYTDEGIPIQFASNSQRIDVDTTALISVEAAMVCLGTAKYLDIIPEPYGDERFSTTHPKEYSMRVFLEQPVKKFILYEEDIESKNKTSLVYQITLRNYKGCCSQDTVDFYVNAHTGEVETEKRGFNRFRW